LVTDPHVCKEHVGDVVRCARTESDDEVADPMFVNPATGDYGVKDGSPALTLGFKNFPMTGFVAAAGP
jgi:hypothetical protein